MKIHSSVKLYNLLRNLGILKHKNRQEFCVDIIEGLILSRSVTFSDIAEHIDKDIKTSSITRMIQDFFKKIKLNYDKLALLLLSFVHHKKVHLSMDRTEWDFGKLQINILCISVSIGKMAVPLYFEMLDNKSGNSNFTDRIHLLESLVGIIGKKRISLVTMDREFIGKNWLRWLKKQKIDFCVRVPKHHKILFPDGSKCTAEELLAENDGRLCCFRNVIVDNVIVNVSISYGKDGKLLYLIGTISVSQLKKTYHKRWTIEVLFQALKGRGFNIEKSHLGHLERYKKLFALVCLAYTICWATGIEKGRKHPVKLKNHGYPQNSVFRRGRDSVREYLKNKKEKFTKIAINKAISKLIATQKIIV
jgi:hypothetical protein